LGSSAGGRPLGVEVTELVDKAPPMAHDGGIEATPLNATLMASCFIIMMAHGGLPRQLLAVDQGVSGEEPLGLLPVLLVESGRILAVAHGYSMAGALLRLLLPLV
jgi:hypothetical protein